MISSKNGRHRSERTVEETELLLLRDIDNLSPNERATLELVLEELRNPIAQPTGQRLIDVLGGIEYKTPPVDIRTFIKDPFFLGSTCDNIYPKLLDDLIELFEGGYHEAIFCLHPDTPIPLLDGRTRTLVELAGDWEKDPTPFWVYSTTPEGKVIPALAEHPRRTGEDAYFKVTLDDGTQFTANARHQMVLRSGEKRMVREMKPGDSLMPFTSELSVKSRGKRRIAGYELVTHPYSECQEYTHTLVAEHFNGEINSALMTIHHANFRKLDNTPGNLKVMSWEDHTALHARTKHEYFAANPDIHAKYVAWGKKITGDPESVLRKAHKSFMNTEQGRELSRANLAKAQISPEERTRRGRKACATRWTGPNSDQNRKEAAARMAARNRLNTGERASSIEDNEKLLAAAAAGARTVKAAAYALGWSEHKVYNVIYRLGKKTDALFVRSNHFVVSIEPAGYGPVYCMTVPQTANFAICTNKADQSYTRNGVFSSNTGSIGYGKTFAASIGVCRILYELSCMKNPHASYGLAKDSNISILCLSVNESLASKVVYENIVVKIKGSPYFQENFPFEPTKKELRFPNGIWVAPRASTDTSALGLNTISGLMDETNFLPIRRTAMGDDNKAETLYAAIKRRMKSRFERQGKLPGMLFIVSSKKSDQDFTAKRIKASITDPSVFVRDYATWDIKPEDYFNTKRFWVLCGNADIASKILNDEEVARYKDNVPEGSVLVDVPEDFRRDFESDLEGAIRDLAGVATVSVRPFIQRREKIREAVDPSRSHPFSVQTLDLSRGGNFIWQQLVGMKSERAPGRVEFERLRPRINPSASRHVHIDIGLRKDALGLCMGHIAGWTNVVRRADDGREYTDQAPLYEIDLALRVTPPLGGEIILSEVRHLIYDLSTHGFTITSVSFDSYQSADSIQAFNAKGYNAQIISVDLTPEPYDTLKMALYENRLKLYDYPPLLNELSHLQEDHTGRRRKIDHPPNGSKDLADALAGAVFTLSQQRLTQPVPILKSQSYVPDTWMEEQRQASMAGNLGAGVNSLVLPPILMGSGGDDWSSPWRP